MNTVCIIRSVSYRTDTWVRTMGVGREDHGVVPGSGPFSSTTKVRREIRLIESSATQ